MHTMTNDNTSDCEYTQLPTGIHEFIFHKSSRSAVDFHIGTVEDICKNTSDDERRYFLSDFSESGMLPIRYGMNKVRDLSKAGITLNNLTIAIVINDNLMTQTLTTLVNTFAKNTKIRFFGVKAKDEALQWLESEIETMPAVG